MSKKNAKSLSKKTALEKIKKKSSQVLSATDLSTELRKGDVSALSTAITLLESTSLEHRKIASEIISICLPHSGKSFRLGITGVPGVGKSTFIESFSQLILQKYKKLAVLAVDPSSQKTKGSILGDKTRMQSLMSNKRAFIRPSPTSTALGGVAKATRESIILCEAAGYDFILIETVGVGQSETEVHSMVDFFMLLMLSGAGDELQGIKKGIIEMADALLINKADGENVQASKRAMIEYKSALHLLPPSEHLFPVEVKTCSGLTADGLEEVLHLTEKFKKHVIENGFLEKNRSLQDVNWFRSHLNHKILESYLHLPQIKDHILDLEIKIKSKEISPFQGANTLLQLLLNPQ